jgi:hypothetical protein
MNAPFEMDRRSLIQRILVLAGAAVIPAGCRDLSGGPGSDFKFETEQFALLSAIADTIIPKGDTVGALDAEVPRKLEELLRNWASAETRAEILAGLERVDAAASAAKGKGFAELGSAVRLEVLKAHEAEAMKPSPDKAPREGGVTQTLGPPAVDAGYARTRELIIKLFYYSEPALTQELEYEHDPGGYQSSVPVTPETRPNGGLSPI